MTYEPGREPHLVTAAGRLYADTAAINAVGKAWAVHHLGFGDFRATCSAGPGGTAPHYGVEFARIDHTLEGRVMAEAYGFIGRAHLVFGPEGRIAAFIAELGVAVVEVQS